MFKHKGVHRPGKAAAAKRAAIPPKSVAAGSIQKGTAYRSDPNVVKALLKKFGGRK